MLHTFLITMHLLIATIIVVLVLVQRGKGAEAGAGFGAGASGTVFGARGTHTVFSRATAVLATLFFITTVLLAYVGEPKQVGTSTIEQQVELERQQQLKQATTPAAPGAPTATSASPAAVAPAAPASGTTEAPAQAPPAPSSKP